MQRVGMASLLGARDGPERQRVLALIASRILSPDSKLATPRWWGTTTLPDHLGVADGDEHDLYAAMDWLLTDSVPSRRSWHAAIWLTVDSCCMT